MAVIKLYPISYLMQQVTSITGTGTEVQPLLPRTVASQVMPETDYRLLGQYSFQLGGTWSDPRLSIENNDPHVLSGNITTIQMDQSITGNITLTLPSETGTIALTTDIPNLGFTDGLFDGEFDDETGNITVAPYSSRQSSLLHFYTDDNTNPTNTDRLNLDGAFHSTSLTAQSLLAYQNIEVGTDTIDGALIVGTGTNPGSFTVNGTSSLDGNVTIESGADLTVVDGLTSLNGGIVLYDGAENLFSVDTSGNTVITGSLSLGDSISVDTTDSEIIYSDTSYTSTLKWEGASSNNFTLLLPDMSDSEFYALREGEFTLATTDDLPPISTESTFVNFTFDNDPTSDDFGQIALSPFSEQQVGQVSFDTSSTLPGNNLRLNLNAHLYTAYLNVTNSIETSTFEATSTADVRGDFKVGADTAETFTVEASSGNTYIAGTLEVDGVTQLDGILNANSTSNFAGAAEFDSSVGVDGTLRVGPSGANDFTVTGTGNIFSSGTLSVIGAVDFQTSLAVTGLSSLNGGIAVDTDKFTVAANGDTSISGTLDVDGVTTLVGLLDANGGIAVNTDNFTVAANGATYIDNTLEVFGVTTLDEDLIVKNGSGTTVFSVDDATGNVSSSGDIVLDGNITVGGGNIFCLGTGTNPTFNIGSSNTNPQGATLNLGSQAIVDGASRTINIGANGELGSDTTVNIGSVLEDPEHSIINLYGTVNVIGGTGSVITTDELNVADNTIVLNSERTSPFLGTSGIVVNRGPDGTYTDALFVFDEPSLGNGKWVASNGLIVEGTTLSEGTLTSQGNFSVGASGTPDVFTVDSTNGNAVTSGTLTVTGQTNLNGGLILDTDKFIVEDNTGNTTIAGTLTTAGLTTLNGGITADGGVFTVADTTGNIYTEGTLEVDGLTTLNNTLVINDGASDLFTVDGTSGNTDIQGTLDVAGATELADTLLVSGLSNLDGGIEVFDGTDNVFTVDTSGNVVAAGNVEADTFNKVTITEPANSATLTIADTKTLTVNDDAALNTNNITFASGESVTAEHASLTVGTTTGTGDVTVTSDSATARTIEVGGDLTTNSDITFTSDSNVARTITLGGNIDIDALLKTYSAFTVGSATDTGSITIKSSDTNARTLTLGDNSTINSLTNGHVLIATADDTIGSEAQLSLSRGGLGVNASSVAQNSFFAGPSANAGAASFRSFVNDDLPDSGVAAGTYSAVEVNSKGVVTAGAQVIEVGYYVTNQTESTNDPSDNLVEGGLFFEALEPLPAT